MNKSVLKFAILSIIFTLALSVNYLFAAWSGPTQAPPGGNTPTPVNVGAVDQIKNAGLGLNALSVFGGGYFQGNVGVGVVSPSQKLDVAGGIEVGNTTNATAGTIRWSGSDFEGYDGSAWVSLTTGGEGDGGGLCPDGQDSVVVGGTSICLADGATASASCSKSGGNFGDYSDKSATISLNARARYINSKIQTSVSINGSGGRNFSCNSGWVDGLGASTSCGDSVARGNASAQTSSNGVSGSGSGKFAFGGSIGNLNCSTSVGAWK